MQNSYSSRETEYAGFWVRLAAYVIDSIIVFFGLLFVRLFLSGIMSVLSATWIGGNILFHYTLKDILLYGFQVLYFILCTYLTGTTLGKRAMNLRVVSADGQKPVSYTHLNGANEMAKKGKNYQEILTLFYQGAEIGA